MQSAIALRFAAAKKAARRQLRSVLVGVGRFLGALFFEQHADTQAFGIVGDAPQQPLIVLDIQALNEPIHDAPPQLIFRDLDCDLDDVEVCA